MDKALQTMIDNMPEKTGRSLQEWKKMLQAKNFTKHGEAVKFLKDNHGVTHGFANTIVALSKGENEAPEDLIAEQYQGKEGLKPLYEKLMAAALKVGSEVTVAPKKGSVSLIRKKQFALIKPATRTRIDLGLKLPGKPLTARLQHSGPFGTMCTHRVQLTRLEEVDKELIQWLAEAYEQAGQ
jgi:hypothetical protein